MKIPAKHGLVIIGLLSGSILGYGQVAGRGTAQGTAGRTAGTGTVSAGGAAAAGQAGTAVGGAAVTPGNQAATVPPGTRLNNPVVVDTTGSQISNPLTPPSQPVTFNSLPAPVQATLRSQAAATGSVGPVSQRMTVNGPVYTVSVVQNGVPVEMQIAANGRILPSAAPTTGLTRNPALPLPGAGTTVTVGTPGAAVGGLGTAQAGLPVNALPPAIQNSIQSQLPGAQIQTVSRDDLAGGSIFRVTALQNGVPTEFRFAANGALLGAVPITGTATSPFVPGVVGTLATTPVLLPDLPESVQQAIRNQVGTGRLGQIAQQQTPTGLAYWVSYDRDGRPMLMMLNPDGTIRTNIVGGVGAPAQGAIGTATATNRNEQVSLNDLPDAVQAMLREQAPFADIRLIEREKRPSGDVYRIAFRENDRYTEIMISADGRIMRDSRDVPIVAVGAPKLAEEPKLGMDYSKLPVAIQNAIKAYATERDVRGITLGLDKDGKTIYDVVFYADGQRDRMIIAKDGMVQRVERNVSPALEILPSYKEPVLAMGDLPQQVQDTIRRQTDTVPIEEIKTKLVGDQTVYQVKYQTNGAPVELLVASDGAIVYTQGAPEKAPGEPQPAPLPARDDEEEVVRVIQNSDAPQNADAAPAAGAAAKLETGAEVSERKPAQEVALTDVPEPVQNTAKKLAGTALIESINPRVRGAAVVYEITFSENGNKNVVFVDGTGAVKPELEPSEP